MTNIGKPTCNHCGLDRTPEGHDGCIGTLKGVKNACCGHGGDESPYVQFDHPDYKNNPNKVRLGGEEALEYIRKHRNSKICLFKFGRTP